MHKALLDAFSKHGALSALYQAEWPQSRRDALEEGRKAFVKARKTFRIEAERQANLLFRMAQGTLVEWADGTIAPLPHLDQTKLVMLRQDVVDQQSALLRLGWREHEKILTDLFDIEQSIRGLVNDAVALDREVAPDRIDVPVS